jgi:hypothetical protein
MCTGSENDKIIYRGKVVCDNKTGVGGGRRMDAASSLLFLSVNNMMTGKH